MRAIVFSRPGEFSLTEVPEPAPGPRDAIVRSKPSASAEPMHVLDGELRRHAFPIVPGHEASGVVVNVGDEVATWHPEIRLARPRFTAASAHSAWSDAATCARTGTAPGGTVGRLCRRARPLASQEPASSAEFC